MSSHYSPFHRGPDDHDPPPPYVPPLPTTAPSAPSAPSAPTDDVWQNRANHLAENMRNTAAQHQAQQQAYAPNAQAQQHAYAPQAQTQQHAHAPQAQQHAYVPQQDAYAPQVQQHAPHPYAQRSFSSASNQSNISRQYSTTSAQAPPSRQASVAHPPAPAEPPVGPFYSAPPPAGPFYPSNGSSPAPPSAAAPMTAEPRVYPGLQQQTSRTWQDHPLAQPPTGPPGVQPPTGPLYPAQPPRGPLYNSDTEGVSSYGATGGTTMFNAMPSRVESSSEISTGSSGRCCNIL